LTILFFDDLKTQIKDKIPDDPTKTKGLYSLVSVATEVKYDLTTNAGMTDGLTNGPMCVIENIDYRVENSTRQKVAKLLQFFLNVRFKMESHFLLLCQLLHIGYMAARISNYKRTCIFFS